MASLKVRKSVPEMLSRHELVVDVDFRLTQMWRFKVANVLIRLAAWVLGCKGGRIEDASDERSE